MIVISLPKLLYAFHAPLLS